MFMDQKFFFMTSFKKSEIDPLIMKAVSETGEFVSNLVFGMPNSLRNAGYLQLKSANPRNVCALCT